MSEIGGMGYFLSIPYIDMAIVQGIADLRRVPQLEIAT